MADSNIPTYTLNDGTTLPAVGFGTYPLKGEDGIAAIVSALEVGLPAARHRGQLRERDRGRRGAATLGSPPRRGAGGQQAARPPPRRTTTPSPRCTVRSSGSGWTTSTCTSSTGRTPASDKYVEAWRALVDLQGAGAGPLDRRLQLHRGPPRTDHRRHRRHARGQPDRAAPALPAAGDAPGPRAARHPHRGLEPDGQAAGAARGARGDRGRRAARRDARAGDPALARADRLARRSRSRAAPSASARTSTSSASSSPTRRSPPSPRWPIPTAGSSAATRTPTRRCELG